MKAKFKHPEVGVVVFDVNDPPDFCTPTKSCDGSKAYKVIETGFWPEIIGDLDLNEPLNVILLNHEDNGLNLIGPYPDGGYTLLYNEDLDRYFEKVEE